MCSSCHDVAAGATSPNPAAPPSKPMTLSYRPGEEFANFLNTAHPVMQNPPIHPAQTEDMALFIASLKSKPR
jgi:hypothetical protein